MRLKPKTGDLITDDFRTWQAMGGPEMQYSAQGIKTSPETWEEELNSVFENYGISPDVYFAKPNGNTVLIKKGESE
jgi:hypothetical protein